MEKYTKKYLREIGKAMETDDLSELAAIIEAIYQDGYEDGKEEMI